MNSYMNISVRVLSANAQAQIKALQAQVRALQGQLAAANATSAAPTAFAGAKSRKSLMAYGNQIQWTGRQIQYNWTLPILLAAGAATKFALDNEKAFTRVQKVYGDTQEAAAQFNKEAGKAPDALYGTTKAAQVFENELKALDGAFEALSSRYGVNQAEVLETAGAWAAAGASGLALAESTQISLKAAILGDMELGKATESLIAIQSQYSLSTKQLNLTLAELNAIENQTGISMQGLIDGFARSAGVAREAGVDVRHLGAMLAALVPATGSAANAGNSLKTIISRLMSPTKDAADVMREFGVNTADAAWQSSTAVERLTILASHMGDSLKESADGGYVLSDSQKQVVASVLGSRYQMNRFLVLMREMGPAQSYYEKALAATADRQKVFEQSTRELNAVLDSNPRRLAIIWATLQNGMADAIQPMIPYILYLAQSIGKLVEGFNSLDPSVQKMALVMLLMLAAVGPVVRYFGSLLTLIGAMALPLKAAIGWWVTFATVTKTVDGVATTTRRSIFGMMMSLIKWPFAMIAAGFSGIIGSIITLGARILALGPISRATAAVMAGAPTVMAAAWAASSAALRGIWAATMSWTVLVHSQGIGMMVRNWLVGLSLMGRGVSAFAGITAIFHGIFAAISVLFSTQMFIPLIMAMGRLSTAMTLGWSAMWASMHYVMVTGQLAMLGAMATFRATFLGGWAGIHLGMHMIATKGYALLLRAYVAFSMGLNAVMTAGARVMTATWAALHVGMAAISRAFWIATLRVWFAGALALPKVLAGVKNSITKIWALIVLAQRSGALAAAAAAAGPWVAAGAAIIGIVYMFRSQLKTVWNNLVAYFADSTNEMTSLVLRAWNSLPQGVANALTAVARIVQQAALQIYEWFSYINPFARHSPSLVENVTEGMRVVGDQFGNASNVIGGHVKRAYGDIKAFGKAVRGVMNGAASFEQARERASIKKFAPGALVAYDRLASTLKALEGDLAGLQVRMDKQQAVVDRWTGAVDRANAAIDAQQAKLDKLTAVQQTWQDRMDEATTRLDSFASAPIKGMGAMSDKIFENEMAQKRLRLEMMKMEDTGATLEDVRSKIDAITGAQELLRGEQASLRSAGAGSEITSLYDEQIAKLEEQKQAQVETSGTINEMSTALAELERQGQRLDLQNSLRFDPLTREIAAAANAMDELPFDKIMVGVTGAAADIQRYQVHLDAASAAVERQKAVVDRMTLARDGLQARLDSEQAKLDKVKDAYDRVNDAIGDVKSTMEGASSAAQTLASKAADAAEKAKKAAGGEGYVSPAVQNFRDAAGGNFANVGGAGIPVRTDWSDQTADIDKFTQDIADQASKAFGDLNPFSPIKEKWGQFKGWLIGAWADVTSAVNDMFSNATAGVGAGAGLTKAADKFRIAWAKTRDWFQSNVFDPLVSVWRLFWPSIKEFFTNAWNGIKEIFKQVGPVIGDIFKEFGELGPAFKGFWNVLKPVLVLIGGPLLLGLKMLFSVAAKTIYPILQMVGNVFENIMQILKGAIQVVSGFFMLFAPGHFKEGVKKMLAGVYNIFAGTFGAIGQLIRGAFKTIVMAFWGIVDGIIDAAMWLWDEMVGHSIIPDLINGIIFWFKKLGEVASWVWDNVVRPIFGIFRTLLSGVISAIRLWWTGVTTAFSVLKMLASWFWNNVLHPIFKVVKALWDNYVGPLFAFWWEGIKLYWNVLKGVAKWLWKNVLQPVWDKVRQLWDKYVGPAFGAWWNGIKRVWNGMKAASKWVWENVLKPVWEKFKDVWDKFIQPALSRWWRGIQNIWSAMKAAGRWVWDNVLKPVFERFKDLWVSVKGSLGDWWGGIKNVWSSLKGLGGWVYDNVMKPVKDKITGVWGDIKKWLTDNKDMLTGPVKSIVNVVIDAVNAIVKGLNKVADILPGVDWDINLIPRLAQGGPMGRRANRGFKTAGARAIVGEGKANHPEFVIPTDPTYRHRARGLLAMAHAKINGGARAAGTGIKNATQRDEHGVPQFGIGGWLGDKWEQSKKIGSAVSKLSRNAVGKMMDPLLDKARDTIKDTAPWKPIQSPPLFAINKLEEWVKGADSSVNAGVKKYSTPIGGNVSVGPVGSPGAISSWRGGMFSNKFIAHMQKAEKIAGATVNVMQGGFRPQTSYSGTSHQGDAVDFQASSSLIKAFRRVGIAAGDRTGLGNWAPHTHAVPGPQAGYAAGSAPWQFQDYMARGGMSQSLSSPWGLKAGGVALKRRGPTFAALGDGRYDEAVVPLPPGWRDGFIGSSGGDTVININGDLSFPNISDGDDAKEFIDNLKVLARG